MRKLMNIKNMNTYLHSFSSHEQWNHHLVFLGLRFPLTECSVSVIMSQSLFLQFSVHTHWCSKDPYLTRVFTLVIYMGINTVHIQDKQRISIGTQHLKQAHFLERNDIRIVEGSTDRIRLLVQQYTDCIRMRKVTKKDVVLITVLLLYQNLQYNCLKFLTYRHMYRELT